MKKTLLLIVACLFGFQVQAQDAPEASGTSEAPGGFGIVSYNILEGFRNSANNRFPAGSERYAQVRDWLIQEQPAIVGFQELNGYTEARLGEQAQEWGHGYAAILKDSGYSTGLTSRYPIEVIDRELEGMHHGFLHCRTAGIDVFVIHLSPFRFEHRQREAAIILERVAPLLEAGGQVIVLGDFNALSPLDAEVVAQDEEALERRRRSDAQHDHVQNLNNGEYDFSVLQAFMDAGLIDLYAQQREEIDLPRSRIDFILTSPNLAEHCVDAQWINTDETRRMSDHPPVIAELDWQPETEE